ncbi:hypothetical protein RAS1_22440 [Phycisphaerae bacterium RAS1]|nr:hypothetical protein RAS1_22440 [Phycisphaerae bacterium RAS1]
MRLETLARAVSWALRATAALRASARGAYALRALAAIMIVCTGWRGALSPIVDSDAREHESRTGDETRDVAVHATAARDKTRRRHPSPPRARADANKRTEMPCAALGRPIRTDLRNGFGAALLV